MLLLTRSCCCHGGIYNSSGYQRIAKSIFNDSRKTIIESMCNPTISKIKLTDYRQLSSQTNEEKQPRHEASNLSKSSKKPISSAMKFYLERKKQHDSFIAKERSEFELGKKHLANMMGMNYDAMTQEDVDKAIEYLFPSGLYDEEARPKMKPPEEVYLYDLLCFDIKSNLIMRSYSRQ